MSAAGWKNSTPTTSDQPTSISVCSVLYPSRLFSPSNNVGGRRSNRENASPSGCEEVSCSGKSVQFRQCQRPPVAHSRQHSRCPGQQGCLRQQRVPLPPRTTLSGGGGDTRTNGAPPYPRQGKTPARSRPRKSHTPDRKGIPWTQEKRGTVVVVGQLHVSSRGERASAEQTIANGTIANKRAHEGKGSKHVVVSCQIGRCSRPH